MSWNYHLYDFEFGRTRYGIPDPDWDYGPPTRDARRTRLDKVAKTPTSIRSTRVLWLHSATKSTRCGRSEISVLEEVDRVRDLLNRGRPASVPGAPLMHRGVVDEHAAEARVLKGIIETPAEQGFRCGPHRAVLEPRPSI
jgi:hypothetical protein